jgi:hypothetical protein
VREQFWILENDKLLIYIVLSGYWNLDDYYRIGMWTRGIHIELWQVNTLENVHLYIKEVGGINEEGSYGDEL